LRSTGELSLIISYKIPFFLCIEREQVRRRRGERRREETRGEEITEKLVKRWKKGGREEGNND
jgi:hypothetical protein